MALDQSTLFTSLGNVASLINASSDLDATLTPLLEAICTSTVWAAGGIMTVDTESGFAEVIARHDPGRLGADLANRWALSESPSRLALEKGEPVIVRDARRSRKFPGYRREAIEHGYATVVVLPMTHRSPEGHRTVLSVRASKVVDVGPLDVAFLKFAVHLGEIAMSRARALAEERAFNQRLRDALNAHAALLDQSLSGGSLEMVASEAASMLSNPVAVVDLAARRVLVNGSPAPATLSAEDWRLWASDAGAEQLLELARRPLPDRVSTVVIPLTIAGAMLQLSAAICPVNVDGSRVGALIAFSRAADYNDLDHLLLDSARFGIAVQMMRGYVTDAAEGRSQEDLLAEILKDRGRVSKGLLDRARRLAIRLDQPAEMILFSFGEDARLSGPQVDEAKRVLRQAVRNLKLPAGAVAQHDAAIILWLPVRQGTSNVTPPLLQRLVQEFVHLFDERPIVQRSRICLAPSDYFGAWQDCLRVRALARRFERRGIVAAEDFGPFPALMSAVDKAEMLAFVENLLGPVVRHDATHGTSYTATLSSYLDLGGRSQACADALGLHVTTLRYRLARLQELFALEMETPEQRFALQLALQFHRVTAPPEPDDPGRPTERHRSVFSSS